MLLLNVGVEAADEGFEDTDMDEKTDCNCC